jgi:peptide/nickel transport system substrate-binding protein
MGMNISRRTVIKAGTIAAAMATIARTPALAADGGTLNVGLTYDIDTLNVYSTGYLGDVQAAVVEGLVAPDEHAKYVPVLATEVPTLANGGIELVDDGKKMTITYKLRPGVKWHDGQPFTSADVAFTWQAVKDEKFIAESKDGTEDVEKIETPDDLTAVVYYNTVAPDFASTLFTFGILPKHTLEGKDLNTDAYNEIPLGTGPFVVKEFKRGQYVLTERNPDYWRKADDGSALPKIERMVFKIVPDSNTLITQLKSGELDLVVQVPYNQAKQLESVDRLELVKAPLLSWQHLDFNFKGPKSLQDVKVRQAIAHAINRDTLVKALGGHPVPVKSIVVPVFEFYDDTTPTYDFDAAKAAALLDGAGYKVGGDGVREKDGERLSYRLVGQAGRADDEIVEQVIIAQLKAIGIEAKIDNKTGVAFREARYKGDYDLLYGRWITSADPVYSVFYGTKTEDGLHGQNNGQGYSNPKLDEVLAKLESTLDPAARKELSSEMQHMVAEDLVTIPLTTNVALIAKVKTLKNFVPNPTNMTNFVDTSHWTLEG